MSSYICNREIPCSARLSGTGTPATAQREVLLCSETPDVSIDCGPGAVIDVHSFVAAHFRDHDRKCDLNHVAKNRDNSWCSESQDYSR